MIVARKFVVVDAVGEAGGWEGALRKGTAVWGEEGATLRAEAIEERARRHGHGTFDGDFSRVASQEAVLGWVDVARLVDSLSYNELAGCLSIL